eukprot:767094-Hanusia_phi.AAC.1
MHQVIAACTQGRVSITGTATDKFVRVQPHRWDSLAAPALGNRRPFSTFSELGKVAADLKNHNFLSQLHVCLKGTFNAHEAPSQTSITTARFSHILYLDESVSICTTINDDNTILLHDLPIGHHQTSERSVELAHRTLDISTLDRNGDGLMTHRLVSPV